MIQNVLQGNISVMVLIPTRVTMVIGAMMNTVIMAVILLQENAIAVLTTTTTAP